MGTATSQLTERGRRTRDRLLDAAESQLLTGGRLEVTNVAMRAGASLGLLYRYFDGKDGLVAAVVHRFYDRYEEAVFAVPADGERGWFVQERDRLEREVAFLLGDPLAARIVAGPPEEPAAAQADALRMHDHIQLAARNIRHGQRRGEIDPSVDAQLAAAGFIGALRATVGTALTLPRPPEPAAVTEPLWRMGVAVIVPACEARVSDPVVSG